jgi:DNA-binding CsgD family transcriptional regulator
MSRHLPRGSWMGGNLRRAPEPDHAAVERILARSMPAVTTREDRIAALARIDQGKLSASEIAHRLGCTVRTVQRHRALRRTDGGQR